MRTILGYSVPMWFLLGIAFWLVEWRLFSRSRGRFERHPHPYNPYAIGTTLVLFGLLGPLAIAWEVVRTHRRSSGEEMRS